MFGHAQKCNAISPKHLINRDFGIARWRRLLKVLNLISVILVHHVIGARTNEIKCQRPTPEGLDEFKFCSCCAEVVGLFSFNVRLPSSKRVCFKLDQAGRKRARQENNSCSTKNECKVSTKVASYKPDNLRREGTKLHLLKNFIR